MSEHVHTENVNAHTKPKILQRINSIETC